jgi:hypothetical protein
VTIGLTGVVGAIVCPDIAPTVVGAAIVTRAIILVVPTVAGPAATRVPAIVVGGASRVIDVPRLVSVVLVVVRRTILAPP